MRVVAGAIVLLLVAVSACPRSNASTPPSTPPGWDFPLCPDPETVDQDCCDFVFETLVVTCGVQSCLPTIRSRSDVQWVQEGGSVAAGDSAARMVSGSSVRVL